MYTKKRLYFMYPSLSKFVAKFRAGIEGGEAQQAKLYSQFRKDVKEIAGDSTQILRAKVVAT